MKSVYAVVPAAGRSRRMGTQKMLLPFAGSTVIGQVVRTLRSAPLRGVVVVVSPDGGAVEAEALAAGASTVVNPDQDADMLSSVRCGIRALPVDADAALVALGDQPTVKASLVASLVQAFSARTDAIVVPVHRGTRGHPLLVASRWFGGVLTRYDGTGLRGLLSEQGDSVVELHVDDEWVLRDVDDPADYRAAVGRTSDDRLDKPRGFA